MKRIFKRIKHKSNSYIPLCILLLLSFSAPTLYAAEDVTPTASSQESFTVEAFNGTYYVSSSGGLNVRQGPSIQYDIIGTLPYGEEITVTGSVADDWFEISYQGTNGYISAKYVSAEPLITLPIETEETPELPETIIEDTGIEQEFTPFISDTTLLLLLLAITSIIVIIVITVFSFFRNHHNYEYAEYDNGSDDDSDYDNHNN